MLKGRAVFDRLAEAGKGLLDLSYKRAGIKYVLTQCESVTGPHYELCEVDGFYDMREVVKEGHSALVVRYSCPAFGSRPRVDAERDVLVLGSIELPEDVTAAQLLEEVKMLLENARR